MFTFRTIVFTFVVLLTACGKSSESPKTPLKLGMVIWPGTAYAYLAQHHRLFEKYGVTVELTLKGGTVELFNHYKYGELDGFLDVFNYVVTLNAQGTATQVVYVMDYSDTGDAIVGRSSFASLSDLQGKTISFEGVDTFSQMLVVNLLAKAGVKEGQFKTVNLPALKVLEALDAGQIDAGHTWEPVTSQALAKGYKILGKAGDIPGIITDVLAIRKEVIEQRPADVQGVVEALVEARNWLSEHPQESLEIMAKAEGMTTAEMESGVKGVHHPTLSENIAAMRPGGALFQAGDYIANFYLNNGQLVQKPDINTLIETRFVLGIK